MKTSITTLAFALLLPLTIHAQTTGAPNTTATGTSATTPPVLTGPGTTSTTGAITSSNAAANEAMFRALDKNHDGVISREEFLVGMSGGLVPATTGATNSSGTGSSSTGRSGTGTSNAGTSGTGTSSAGTTGTTSGATGTSR